MLIKMNDVDVSYLLLSYKRSGNFSRIVGNAPAQVLKISLDNYDDVFEYNVVKDAIFTVKPTDNSKTYYFKVYEMPESWDSVLNLTLYDSMYLFDTVYSTKLSYPTSIENQLIEMETLTGVIIDYSNVNKEILERQTNQYDSTITIRSYLKWIAEMSGCNVLSSNEQYGKVSFVPFINEVVVEYPDVFDYKKGNLYSISKVEFNDSIRIFSNGDDDGNIYYLANDNIYITEQSHIDIVSQLLIDMKVNSATDINVEHITDIELGNICRCVDDFDFIVLDFEETYSGGDSPDYVLNGELTTENQEQVGVKVNNSTKIRRLQVITNEQDLKLTIIAEHQEGTDKELSEFELSLDGIKSSVESTSTEVKTIKEALEIEYQIESTLGYFFESESDEDSILTARIFKDGEEIDPDGNLNYTWYCRHDGASDEDILGTGKSIILKMDHFVDNALIYFTAEDSSNDE